MKALVYKSTGSWYIVKDKMGKIWNARIKGVFKIDDISSTNPVAVGDEVEIEVDHEEGTDETAMITTIYERRNYINRQSPRAKYQQHIIAANIDQSILIATLREPRTSQGFIDRFLVVSEAYHIPSIIVFNKADIYKNKEQYQFEHWKKMYEDVGYMVILMSVKKNTGISSVVEQLNNKITLFSGHSGVGKSSFINFIIPELHLKTRDISGWSGKGLHTTTFAEMFDLPPPVKGKIIDTPGLREFGLIDISKQELSHYFPEMRIKLNECKFNNCLHINEPGCAVKNGILEETISMERYNSYCNILASIEEKQY